MYICPICKEKDLSVIHCVVDGDMDLDDDGFIIEGNTTDEIVRCKNCEYEAEMSKFSKEE